MLIQFCRVIINKIHCYRTTINHFCLLVLAMSGKNNGDETRAGKAASEQIQLYSRGRSVEILDEETPPLVVHRSKLRVSPPGFLCVCTVRRSLLSTMCSYFDEGQQQRWWWWYQ